MSKTLSTSPTRSPVPAAPRERIHDDGLPPRPDLVLAYGLMALSGTIMGLVLGILFF